MRDLGPRESVLEQDHWLTPHACLPKLCFQIFATNIRFMPCAVAFNSFVSYPSKIEVFHDLVITIAEAVVGLDVARYREHCIPLKLILIGWHLPGMLAILSF